MSDISTATATDALHRQVEDAGINASAPCEQRWIDGWLVRYAHGKARRARCIQPLAAGTLSVDAKLKRCLPVFRDAGLVPHVRITPFAEPRGLDERLAALGWGAIDETLVMLARIDAVAVEAQAALPLGHAIEACDSRRYAAWVGAARGSSAREIESHANRLASSPVTFHAFVVRNGNSEAVAGGQVACEGEVAGLYDVLTLDAQRGRGIATALCAHLMSQARASGAKTSYLQVDAGNAAAIAVYRRLGFTDAYRYHYRTLSAAASQAGAAAGSG